MRLLNLKLEHCNAYPYVAIVGDTVNTIVACKHRLRGGKQNIILEQPMHYVLAEIGIPEWCPLLHINEGEIDD